MPNRCPSFMVDVFDLSDPYKGRGNEVTARQLLDAGSAANRIKFHGAARNARCAHGNDGARLQPPRPWRRSSKPLLEKALAGLVELRGPRHPEIAAMLNEIGNALVVARQVRGRRSAFEGSAEDASRAPRVRSRPKSPRRSGIWATLRRRAGTARVAEQYFRDSLALYSRLRSLDATPAGRVSNERPGNTAQFRRQLRRGGPACSKRRSRSIGARWATDDPRVIMETHNLAFALQAQGEFAAAEPLFRKSNGADAPRIRDPSTHTRSMRCRTTDASCATRAISLQRKRPA